MKFDIVAGRCAEKEEGNLDCECRRRDGDQRPPEKTSPGVLRIGTGKRRTGGRLIQARLPMEKKFNSYEPETSQSTFNPESIVPKTAAGWEIVTATGNESIAGFLDAP
jgi:hypothetical protein